MGLPKTARALFLSDGHPSRYAPTFLKMLALHHIDLYLFPSHTSQCTQPLDLLTFGALKTVLPKVLAENLKKVPPPNVSEAAVTRCCALKACLEALHTATSKSKIKSAFARGGICVNEGKLVLDPSKLAKHLNDPDNVFKAPIEPPERSAIYSCLLNTPELIEQIEIAKNPSNDKDVVKDAWVRLSEIRNEITQLEKDWYVHHQEDLPWKGNELIGTDPNLAFTYRKAKRKSIAPHSEQHWSEKLLQEKKHMVSLEKGGV